MSGGGPTLEQPVPLVFPVESTGVMKPDTEELARVGLCATCAHKREIRSDRGSIFYQCQRAATDARYPQYPRLPVLACAGFEARKSPAEDILPSNSC